MACLVLVGYQRLCKLTRCNELGRWQLGREAHREAIATREVEVTARVRRVRPQKGEIEHMGLLGRGKNVKIMVNIFMAFMDYDNP